MENTPQALDPESDLAILERARKGVALDDFLNFGPWWYAPLLATVVGGLTLFGNDFDDRWNLLYGGAGLVAGVAMAVHDYRRRKVRPRVSPVAVALVIAVVVVCWILAGVWGTAVSTIGYEDFVPGYASIAWGLTTAVFLGLRAGLGVVRRRREPTG